MKYIAFIRFAALILLLLPVVLRPRPADAAAEIGRYAFANRCPVTLLVPKNEQGSRAAAVSASDLPHGSEVTAK